MAYFSNEKYIAVKFRFLLTALCTVMMLFGYLQLDRWSYTLYYGDSSHYYLHVVSAMVNQDVGDYDKTISTLRTVNPGSADPREDKFGIRLTEKGRRYIKYTLGVPIMELPFFAIAHFLAQVLPSHAANGWTPPYLFIVGLSTICYLALGFLLLIKVLEKYFSRKVITLVLLSLVLATNLYYHATYVTMAHGFLFFDYCLLLFLSQRFYQAPGKWRALGLGAMVGLITMTRVPELISLMIPLLWGISSWKDFLARIQFFRKHFSYLIWAAFGLLLAFSPQIGYWYYVSGHLVFNPYDGEGFNFLNPKIYEGFFHFKNGWLLYSPIMFFSLVGLYFLPKYAKGVLLAIGSFLLLHVLIHYSYYAWTYFPGLGQRPMVETYPLLAFPLAAFYQYCFSGRIRKVLPYLLIVPCAILNLFQTWQMNEGIIWSERNNAAFYWETFFRTQGSLNALRAYDTKELQPDSTALNWIQQVYQEGFEDLDVFPKGDGPVFSGENALLSQQQELDLFQNRSIPDAQAGDWLRVSVLAYVKAEDMVFNRDLCQNIMLELFDGDGRKRKRRNVKMPTHIANDAYSIWFTGKPDSWGEAAYFVRLPRKWTADWTIRLYFLNDYGQKVWVDEVKIDHYR